MNKRLENEIMGQALKYYYNEVVTRKIGNIVTAKQFTEVALSVLNVIDVDDIVANYIITDSICER